MVDVTLTATALTAGTASGDLGGTGTSITTGQTFSVPVGGDSFRYMLVMEETGGTTATCVFDAGANPPSLRAGIGSNSTSFSANDIKVMFWDGGRYIQSGSSGLITGTWTGTGRLTVLKIPVHGAM